MNLTFALKLNVAAKRLTSCPQIKRKWEFGEKG
jgi:hypothetical protein